MTYKPNGSAIRLLTTNFISKWLPHQPFTNSNPNRWFVRQPMMCNWWHGWSQSTLCKFLWARLEA